MTPPFAAALFSRYVGVNKEGNTMTNATAISRSRVWSVLTTPAAIPRRGHG